MTGDDRLETALDLCYEAVTQPERWVAALDHLAEATGAAAAMFYPKNANETAAEQAVSTGYQGIIQDYVAGGWYEKHYRAERGWPLLARRRFTVVTEHDLATDDERRRLPHYNDLYLRWGFSGFAAIGFKVEEKDWCLPLLKTVDQGFFSREEAEGLAFLGPHLRRMIHLSEQYAHACASGGVEALEQLGRAAALIDWKGRVMEMNGGAERLLADPANSLAVLGGRLHSRHAVSNLRLQALLDSAGSGNHRLQRTLETIPIRIERPDRRPLLAELISIRNLVTPLSRKAFGILTITDPDARPSTDEARLSAALGLTGAEARLALLLAGGESIEGAAAALGVATGTARDRVKTIFFKTDTHRQGELVALLSRILR